VVGLLRGQLGLGEAARLVIAALDAGGVPLMPVVPADRAVLNGGTRDYAAAGVGDAGFDTNLVCLNPDQHWKLVRETGGAFGADRHTIGFWWWEVADAMKLEWRFVFPLVDEVWVATEHAALAIRQVSPVPVVKVRLPVQPGAAAPMSRAELGLPEGFLFLSVFDYDSTLERKNPLAAIEAFRTAFAPGSGAVLVLKSVNASAHPKQRRSLEAAAAGHPDIYMIDQYLPVAEKNAMLATCDCCVSLHRAEGFGLPLAEAMYYGRPTIATRYSGNLEFMTDDNSYLVDHGMSRVGTVAEPYYPADATWAAPDVAHAARLMRRVFEQRDESRSRGRRAAADMRRDFSPEAAAGTMTSRLDEVHSESSPPEPFGAVMAGGPAALIRRALGRPRRKERELLARAGAFAAARRRDARS
jgi:glycosyltransferase involved in cell wall biosynthesis